MTGAKFLAAFLTLPLLGAGLLLSRRFDWMPRLARGVASVAVGSVLLCGEAIALTVIGVRWSLPILLAVPVALSAWALFRRKSTRRVAFARARPDRITAVSLAFLFLAAAAVALLAFAALTARVTSSDLLLFWAAKGEHFGLAGRIDAAFLGDPNHRPLHSDYPPLWPCLYAFGVLFAGRFAWGAALATLPLFVLLSVVAVWSLARLRVPTREASAFAALFASLFGFLLAVSMTAGNADAPLLFFETIALALLVFAREERGAVFLAGVALAGATLLKLEGTAFSWALIGSCLLLIRPLSWRRGAQLAGPPLVAFIAWYAFCRAHGLIEALGTHKALVLTGERFEVIARGMLSAAALQSWYLPWIIAVFLIVVRKTARTAGFVLLVAGLVAAFDCGIYLTTDEDPTLWIGWAGLRTLLTPLLALLIAGMAPSPRPEVEGFTEG